LAKSPKIKASQSNPTLYCRQLGFTYTVQNLRVLVIPVRIWSKKKKKAKKLWQNFMVNFWHYFCHNFSAERPFEIIFSPIDVTFSALSFSI
jgi:hypothetical protein